ncbi:hypothetical protein PPERSA_02441 [Pseudocohnilembus persalinus]|uniref:WD40-repeat-containing domain n=1 Tax=Pseudocohnilembus persalinus TaxID=266149 RepID=A0A0V0QAX8_PSEPJ|nr:hypothetical protein PPERSA_02441 [Pseudocohnilembus persalinus]|eukprot:KRW99329.1 hypothetical protein PPERSA_02441 [Pseudocohnilembus persalinus]
MLVFFNLHQIKSFFFSTEPIHQRYLAIDSKDIQVNGKQTVLFTSSVNGRIKILLNFMGSGRNFRKIESSINTGSRHWEYIKDLYYYEGEKLLYLSCGLKGLIVLEYREEIGDYLAGDHFNSFFEYYLENIDQFDNKDDVVVLTRYQSFYEEYQQLQDEILGVVYLGEESVSGAQGTIGIEISKIFRYRSSSLGQIDQVSLAAQTKFKSTYGINKVVLHPSKSEIFIMTEWSFIGSYNYKQLNDGETITISEQNLVGIFYDETNSQKSDMVFSSNGSYLIVTQRGYGLTVLNTDDSSNMYIYQVLDISGNLSEMILKEDESNSSLLNLIVANSYHIQIFQSINGLTGINQIQNLYTFFQSEFVKIQSDQKWPFQWITIQNGTVLLAPWEYDGIRVFYIGNLPFIEQIINYPANSSDGEVFGFGFCKYLLSTAADENIVIMGGGQNLKVIDFNDIYNPVLLYNGTIPGISYLGSLQRIYSLVDDIVIIGAGEKIFVYNFDNPQNPVLVNNPENKDFDSEYLKYCVEFEGPDDFGFTIKYQSKLVAPSIYYVKKSIVNEDIIYASSLYDGIYVLNVSERLNPKIIQHLQLEGTILFLEYDEGENILFATNSYRIQMYVINISDLSDIKLQQTLAPYQEHSIQLKYIIQENKQYIIVLWRDIVRVYPLQIESSLQVVEVYYKDNENFYQVQVQDPSIYIQQFLVGQNYKIKFSIIGDPYTKFMNSVHLYNQENPNDYYSYQENKDSFGQNYFVFTATKEMVGIQSVIQRIDLVITYKDIEKNGVSEQIAKEIYKQAQQYGYLSFKGAPTDKFQINQLPRLQDGYEDYELLLYDVLRRNIQFQPYIFQVVSSLAFDYKVKYSSNYQYITTWSDDIDVEMLVDTDFGIFMEIPMPNLSYEYGKSDGTLSYIKLQGKTSIVNNRLSDNK